MNFAYERETELHAMNVYKPETELHGSCGATLNGEMFVLGGQNQKRQVNIKNIQNPGQFFVKIITGFNKNNLF